MPITNRLSLAWLAFICLLALTGCRENESAANIEVELPDAARSSAPYIKAVHWFGDGWPVNFWNTDLEAVARSDFQKIKDDGFNTIVFLVPWPGFAPDATSGELNEVRIQRLEELMRLAHEFGLMSILRVSYAWDALDDQSARRLESLWLDDSVYEGWLSYLESLWREVNDVPGLQFGFFSWEDLWAITSVADADLSHRQLIGSQLEFDRWVRSRYSEGDLREDFDVTSDEPLPIPHRRERAFALFLEYINEAWIERYFKPAQEKFPKLSMEIRIDSDPIYDGDERVDWFHHTDAWELPGAEWVTLYWSPAMGGRNEGESLAPEEGVSRLESWLDRVAEHAGPKHIFIGQFLVEDFTPGYELNGKLQRDQVGRFLKLAAPVLNTQASGIGLWTWKDYGHDAVPNPQFFAGSASWSSSSDAVFDDNGVRLSDGQRLKLALDLYDYHAPGGPDQATLCVKAKSAVAERSSLTIYSGDSIVSSELADFNLDDVETRHCVEHTTDNLSFEFQADGSLTLTEVSSIGFLQISGMRNVDRRPKSVARDYRALNRKLERRPKMLQPLHQDGWMGKYWSEVLNIPQDSEGFLLRTHLPDDWPVDPNLTVVIDGEFQGTRPCVANGRYRFSRAKFQRKLDVVEITVHADAVHSPPEDQRSLACVLDWGWETASSMSTTPQDSNRRGGQHRAVPQPAGTHHQ
ncbi:MAG: hypothetical protein RI542_08775 [Wenzhouxiangella sp.]|nr:hypothetical protein [Wenzhouxiangella sp.]